MFRGKLPQYILFCAGSFGTMQSGFNLGWPSFALPQLLNDTSAIPLTQDEGSWIASAFPIGTVFGSILSDLLSTRSKEKMLL
ncbi:hypothetical protein FQR65_LT07568 [Abscondita terminalis]|nr:hypothetical protein FQR65_LT07568 [Abscondita terminalis]